MKPKVQLGRLAAIALLAAACAGALAAPTVALANDISSATTATLPIVNRAGSLDATGISDDVYAVYFKAGQTVAFNLTGDPGTDFDLRLFRPSATSVADVGALVTASLTTSTSTEAIRYLVPVSGYYFVDVRARAGAGSFALNGNDVYAITKPTGPSKIKHKVTFTSVVYISPSYLVKGGHPVRFYAQRFEHGAWKLRLAGYAGKPTQDKKKKRTAYAVRIWLTKGNWRIRASISDSLHPIQYSGYRKIRVL